MSKLIGYKVSSEHYQIKSAHRSVWYNLRFVNYKWHCDCGRCYGSHSKTLNSMLASHVELALPDSELSPNQDDINFRALAPQQQEDAYRNYELSFCA